MPSPVLSKPYFHEVGGSPDLVFPDLQQGEFIDDCASRAILDQAYDGARQVVAGVANYSLLRDDPENPGQYLIWVGAREEGDSVHPDTISTFTHRLPISWMVDLIVGAEVRASRDRLVGFESNWITMEDKDAPAVPAVDLALYRKGNWEGRYDRGGVHVSLASLRYGISTVYGKLSTSDVDSRKLEEAILMPNFLVHIGSAVLDVMGFNSDEYSVVGWTSYSSLSMAKQQNSPQLALSSITDEQQVVMCVDGVCIATAVSDFEDGIVGAHLAHLPC